MYFAQPKASFLTPALNDGATGTTKKFHDIFGRLDTMHQRDRWTDRWTDTGSGVAIGCAGCAMHMGQRCGAHNLPDVFFSVREPQVSREPFSCQHISRSHGQSLHQIKERFFSMSSVTMTFGILFPSTLLSASDDELYAAAESLAKQYDTDISSAFLCQCCCRSVHVLIHSCRPSLPFWKLPICC